MKLVKKLPVRLQTNYNKRFFEATFDQVFSKKDSEQLSAFIGHRVGGKYSPTEDYYKQEITHSRLNYQLEPIAYSKNPETLEENNQFFYEDMINRIRSFGGDVKNHDKLFSGKYYSFAPPIDVDKFTNYQNYFWIRGGMPVIEITQIDDGGLRPVIDSDIIALQGSSVVTYDFYTAANQKVNFSNGIHVKFMGTSYEYNYAVEGIGRTIRLVPETFKFLFSQEYEYLLWDLETEPWDSLEWDAVNVEIPADYITIERGSVDFNAWSRTNRWYHKDVIDHVTEITGIAINLGGNRASRPIIEFVRDLELYRSGRKFIGLCDYAFEQKKSVLQGLNVSQIFALTGQAISGGDLVIFLDQEPVVNQFLTPNGKQTSDYVWLVKENPDLSISFEPVILDLNGNYTEQVWPYANFINDNEIVVATTGLFKGLGFYKYIDMWQPQGYIDWVVGDDIIPDQTTNPDAYNKIAHSIKFQKNQEPYFELYSYDLTPLSSSLYNTIEYAGSKIFSYKEDNSSPVVDKFIDKALTFKNLSNVSDIVFEHNLETEKWYKDTEEQIIGYHFFRDLNATPTYQIDVDDSIFSHTWQESGEEKMRVIDRHVVIENHLTTPNNYVKYVISAQPALDVDMLNDVLVYVNGQKFKNVTEAEFNTSIEENIFMVIFDTTINCWTIRLKKIILLAEDVVEAHTYTFEGVEYPFRGYYEVPQELKNNPNNEEITEYSYADFSSHFRSIIRNQSEINAELSNYRDTNKNNSLGEFILQNESPLLKAMMISSNSNLDIISALRFASNEYTRYKNKFFKYAKQQIDTGIIPINASFVRDSWINNIVEKITLVREARECFASSNMFSCGTPTELKNVTIGVIGDLDIILDNYYNQITDTIVVDMVTLSGLTQTDRKLLIENEDYTIDNSGNLTTVVIEDLTFAETGKQVNVRFYRNIPSYMPPTPSKLGMYKVVKPEIIIDNTYFGGLEVIIGHDGSKTPTYGDIRDLLWLEVETRIYNNILYKFKNQYNPPLLLTEAKPGKYRTYDKFKVYSVESFNNISESLFIKWSNNNNANFRVNDYVELVGAEAWKTWNFKYNAVLDDSIPGSWKGIYDYYFDTLTPNITPWEMLGFMYKPNWWDVTTNTGDGFTGYAGDYTSNNIQLWTDLSNGLIRRGDRAGVDEKFKRPYLLSMIPVTSTGVLKSPTILGIVSTPTDENKSETYLYGDYSPVEAAWKNSENYPFSVMEILYLTKPAAFGEYMWDTYNLTRIPQILNHYNQVVNATSYTRLSNSENIVHGEDGTYVAGYQQYISEYLTFLNLDIETNFGDVVRNLDVKLGHKLGGYTNPETLKLFSESVSISSTSTNLLVPTTDRNISVYTSPSTNEYSNSGVIVRALEDGKYEIFGYDILNQKFPILPRNTDGRMRQVEIGASTVDFLTFEFGITYFTGQIVRYNSLYYQCLADHVANTFISANWKKLPKLPTVGGITVTKYLDRLNEIQYVPYGTKFKNAEEVFNFMVSYGEYLESVGWLFDNVDSSSALVNNWDESAKQFLFWVSTSWSPNAAIRLCPSSTKMSFKPKLGYVDNVETSFNNSYNILDADGVLIDSIYTKVHREDSRIDVQHENENVGIFFLRVKTKETEHILTINNITTFNDIIYDPVLGIRQNRMRFDGVRTKNWYGKYEAFGYILSEDGILPNYENMVDSIKEYHNTETRIDNHDIENAARHLIGFESKQYLENLDIAEDVQYQFYQGMIRQKGTEQSISKLLRSYFITEDQEIKVFEEWAVKRAEYGNTSQKQRFDILLRPEDVTHDPQIITLDPKKNSAIDVVDVLNDDIINVDIDDNVRWLSKPRYSSADSLWVMTDDITYSPLNAGYLLPTDATFTAYDLQNLDDKFDTFLLYDTVWVANDNAERWNLLCVLDNGIDIVAPSDESVITTSAAIVDQFGFMIIDNVLYSYVEVGTNQYQVSLKGELIEDQTFEAGEGIYLFKSIRFASTAARLAFPYALPSTTVRAVDNNGTGWEVRTASTVLRTKGKLVDTKLITNSYIYDKDTGDTIVRMPVYDPFKNILPGPAERNIHIKASYDPARYNVSEDDFLIDESTMFDERHVGKTWWDISKCRVMYYEQGSLVERRNNWGKYHPDSQIHIYEWVESDVPPELYDAGTVKNTTDYVVINKYDDSLGISTNKYYFWVRDLTVTPNNVKDRTLSVSEVSRLIANPKSQAYSWANPISAKSFMFANVNNSLDDRNTVIQMNYKLVNEDLNNHAEWSLLSTAKDSNVSVSLWNKFLDSITGYDRLNQVVPAPNLSEFERYGNSIRPRQTWFKDAKNARLNLQSIIEKLAIEITDIPDINEYPFNNFNYDTGFMAIPDSFMIDTLSIPNATILRDMLEQLRIRIFINDFESYTNTIYLGMINYVLVEQKKIDWAFKTSYLVLEQNNEALVQKSSFTRSPFDSVLAYISEAKPYRTKIRSYSTSNSVFEIANIAPEEFPKSKITLKYDNVECSRYGNVGCEFHGDTVDAYNFDGTIAWDIYPWDSQPWDGDAPFEYLTGSDVSATTQFEQIGPNETFVTDGVSSTYLVTNFTIDPMMVGVYLNGLQTMNYYVSGNSIVFLDVPTAGLTLEMYNRRPINGAGFIQPDVTEEVPSELVPLRPLENFVVTVDTDPPYYIDTFDGETTANPDYCLSRPYVNTSSIEVYVNDVLVTTGYTLVVQNSGSWDMTPWSAFFWDVDGMCVVFDAPHLSTDVIEIKYSLTLSTTPTSFKIHVDGFGNTIYDRLSNNHSAKLAADITSTDNTLTIMDEGVSGIGNVASFDNPGVIWVGNEKIMFYQRNGNVLSNLIRGVDGTSPRSHTTNTLIFDASDAQNIPASDTWWTESGIGLSDSMTIPAMFLRAEPGSALLKGVI